MYGGGGSFRCPAQIVGESERLDERPGPRFDPAHLARRIERIEFLSVVPECVSVIGGDRGLGDFDRGQGFTAILECLWQ